MNEAIRMQLSAFADGELPENEKELLLRRLSQDPAMRRQVAEYLAIGRVMRGEAPVPGIEALRDRVAAAIGVMEPHEADDAPPADIAGAPRRNRLVRPAAGFASAAAVAVIAIFGLKPAPDAPESPGGAASTAASDGAEFPTQPAPENLLDQYRLMHDAEAADSSMRTRFTSIELRQGLAEEAGEAAAPVPVTGTPAGDAADAADARTTGDETAPDKTPDETAHASKPDADAE